VYKKVQMVLKEVSDKHEIVITYHQQQCYIITFSISSCML